MKVLFLLLTLLAGCAATTPEPEPKRLVRTISVHNPYTISIKVLIDDQDYGLCQPSQNKTLVVQYDRVQVKLVNPTNNCTFRIYESAQIEPRWDNR